MTLSRKNASCLIVTFALFGALLIPCASILHAMTGEMLSMMNTGDPAHECCALQSRPHFASFLLTVALPESVRGSSFLLLVGLGALVILAVLQIYKIPEQFAAAHRIRTLWPYRGLGRISGKFGLVLRKGVLQPLLYDTVVVR